MRIVLTGGAGFIGSHVLAALLDRGDQVLVLDDLRRGKRQRVPAAAKLVQADIATPAAAAAVAAFVPDAVCHLAAQMDVGASVRAPLGDATTNVLGTLNVLQAAMAAGCRTLVSASSGGAVYGDAAALPTAEGAPCAAQSPYGVSKACSELYLDWAARAYGARCLSLRLSNVYGPGQDHTGEAGVVAIFAAAMLRQQAPTIYGDGEQTRDFVYVGDVARAFVAALDRPVGASIKQADSAFDLGADVNAHGQLNIGTGTAVSLNVLARILAQQCRYRGAVHYAAKKPGEVRHSCLDATRAYHQLGWRAQTALAEGLAATVTALRPQASAKQRAIRTTSAAAPARAD